MRRVGLGLQGAGVLTKAALKEMLSQGVEADSAAYSSVVDACAREGELRRAERWLQAMTEAGGYRFH